MDHWVTFQHMYTLEHQRSCTSWRKNNQCPTLEYPFQQAVLTAALELP